MDQNKQLSFYIPKAVGVKEYAYDEDINYPYRQYMEDRHFIYDNVFEDGCKSILFGILDGHGGKQVAEFVQKNFAKVFVENYKTQKNITLLLETTYQQINNLLKQTGQSEECGSTATIGFIRLEQAKRILYMSNIGDSKAVLCDDKNVKVMTQEHKPTNQEENERIKKMGGIVMQDRVGGVLAVSRAFGDHALTDQGVICTPYIQRIELRVIHKWLVVASDGLWDVINENVVQDVAKFKQTADEVSKSLVKQAIIEQTRDNICVLCLKLN